MGQNGRAVRVALPTASLVVALLLTAPAGLAQAPIAAQVAASPGLALVDTWITAVQRHVPGEVDDAMIVAAGWGDADLATIAMYVHGGQQLAARQDAVPAAVDLRVTVPGGLAPRALVLSADEAGALRGLILRAGDGAALLQRATLLHGDVAMLGPSRIAPMTGPPPRGVERLRVQLGDGQQVLMDRLSAHWGMARALVDRLPRQADDWSRRWYRATTAFLQSKSQFDGLHVTAGLRRFPDDPVLLFFSACEHEAFASPQIQALLQAAPAPRGMRYVMQAAGPELAAAERLFRRALERDPTLVEARVRLARVLRQRGRLDEAATLLRAAVASSLETPLGYYAQLFLGDVEEALGRDDAAGAAYRAAALLMPDAQSPHLALAGLERRAGRREAAQAQMAALLAVAHDAEGADPVVGLHRRPGTGGRCVDARRPPAIQRERPVTARAAPSSASPWRWRTLDALPLRAQQPVFSSRVEAVRVDVLVVDQGRAVPDLTAADFELRDNGVPQEVTSVTRGDAPVSVVLALDVSKSMAGPRLDDLHAAGQALLGGLRSGDRAGIVAFSHVVTQPAPITADLAVVRRALEATTAGGDTALVDATQAALVLGEAEVGRSLVVVFSDGVDTASFLPEDRVLEAARRANAVAYGVWAGGAAKPAFLRALTEATGGRLLDAADGPGLRQAFVDVLGEARQRYLLAFTPTGVAAGGWHTLSVKVKTRRATVRARPGYFGTDAPR